jgi:hypothetical protein
VATNISGNLTPGGVDWIYEIWMIFNDNREQRIVRETEIHTLRKIIGLKNSYYYARQKSAGMIIFGGRL